MQDIQNTITDFNKLKILIEIDKNDLMLDGNYTGPQGEKGDVGDTGPKGEKGDVGNTGPKGEKGDVGATGSKGEKGDVGNTGPKGEKGDVGDIGPKGEKGDVGNIGPKGDKGDIGPPGQKGADGESSFSHEEKNSLIELHEQLADLKILVNSISVTSLPDYVINVQQFGAVGDWNPLTWKGRDNTEAFQAAINFSNETGKTIFIPPGRYRIDGTLYLKKYASFQGTNVNYWGKSAGDGYVERDDPTTNFNEVELFTGSTTVFKHESRKETSLNETSFNVKGVSFYNRKKYDTPRESVIFFYKMQLMRSFIIDCNFNSYDLWLQGASRGTKIINNVFTDLRTSFIKGQNIDGVLPNGRAATIVDSYILNNYINGSQRTVDNVAFDIYYCEHSIISKNFIDYFKFGFIINNCENINISDNIFQFMAIGIELTNIRSININSNIFGLGFERSVVEKEYYDHPRKWNLAVDWFGGSQKECYGLSVVGTNKNVLITNNVGSMCDLLVYVDSNLDDSFIINNISKNQNNIKIKQIYGKNNKLDD